MPCLLNATICNNFLAGLGLIWDSLEMIVLEIHFVEIHNGLICHVTQKNFSS